MNKITAPKTEKPLYWPGTKIVKSTNNGFTRPPGPSQVASAAEEAKARKLNQEAANSHEAQKARGRGFGHATLGGLSKRGKRLLTQAPASISISPRGTSQGARIKKAAL